MSKQKKSIALILTVLTLLILMVSIPPARAQFVLASWSYPDEYGQGISMIRPFENSTGSWVNFGGWLEYSESGILELVVDAAVKLTVITTFNATLTGVSSVAEGKLYHRHNVTVTNIQDEIIFSQQNFTYADGADEENGIYDYEYFVILNFISEYGQQYTVTIMYEIFW